jgi:hypothetical protein
MHEFDEAVLQCFLDNQEQLFSKTVMSTYEEAEDFLIDSMAVIVNSVAEVWEFFEEEGLDTDGMTEDDIVETPEVFALGDGRYLIVQA